MVAKNNTVKNENNIRKCGYVALLGETNAGKSTLVNQLVGQKVSIVSRKIQTTLKRILGIAIYGSSQIIFIDTPGFLRKNSAESLAKIAWDALREAGQILFILDVNKKNFDASAELLKRIDSAKKVSLVLNKIDLIHKPKLLEIAAEFSKIRNFENIFMISALTGSGVEDILTYLDSVLPEHEWEFPEDETTDQSFADYVSEITREHIYHRIHQEIPYKCFVKTESSQKQSDGSIRIAQNIYVKSKYHRAIFVGESGSKIKAIGEAARKELSSLLGCEVHLFLSVLIDNKK